MGKHPRFWFLAITLALMIPTWMVVRCERRAEKNRGAAVATPKENR